MNAKQFKEKLVSLNACIEAIQWAKGKSWEEVFEICHRGDWLLWLFQKTNPDKIRELTLAKGHCANLARQWMKDERSKFAVDAAIAYGEGKLSGKELADAADTAANAAADAYTAADADTAAYAASAAYTAAYTAANAAAAYAAYIAASAAANAAYAAAVRKESLQESADICRKYLPIEIWNL